MRTVGGAYAGCQRAVAASYLGGLAVRAGGVKGAGGRRSGGRGKGDSWAVERKEVVRGRADRVIFARGWAGEQEVGGHCNAATLETP